MGKVAFIFAGQGAQFGGMGKDLCENNKAAAEIFSQADAIRPGTSTQCFTGTAEELAKTVNTQPCMFAMELAAAAAAAEAGLYPDVTAGFSLGELAALTFSKGMTFEEGFRLVCLRAELMQADSDKVDSAMAAILKMEPAQVEEIASQFDQVYPVNYNCPGQITVAGEKEQLAEYMKAVKAAGGRGIPLRVAGGFHSPFMSDAAEKFAEALKDVALKLPEVSTYSDYTGNPYEGDPKELLALQIKNPVRWELIVRNMIADGVDTFVEIGPGTTLSGFVSKIDSQVRTFHVEDMASLEEAIKGVKEC